MSYGQLKRWIHLYEHYGAEVSEEKKMAEIDKIAGKCDEHGFEVLEISEISRYAIYIYERRGQIKNLPNVVYDWLVG